MRLKFIDIIRGSYNLNFLLQEVEGSEKWVAKISKILSDFNLDYRNLDDRAILAGRLAKLAGVNVPESKYISEKEIVDSIEKESLLQLAKEKGYLYNEHQIFISKHIGLSLPQFISERGLDAVINIDDLIRTLVFDLWLGNYDKKDADYVVTNDGIGYSIDYSLCGPGCRDESDNSIGYRALSFSLNNLGDVSFAVGKTLRDIIEKNKYTVDFFDTALSKIESISADEIAGAFSGLLCTRESTHENINGFFVAFLIKRKSLIRTAISNWCKEGYPVSSEKINDIKKSKKISIIVMPEILANTVLQQSLNQVSSVFNNQLMLLDVEKGEYFKLDEIGKEIWLSIEHPITFNQLVQALMQKFDAEESLIADETREFIQGLIQRNLVEIR